MGALSYITQIGVIVSICLGIGDIDLIEGTGSIPLSHGDVGVATYVLDISP